MSACNASRGGPDERDPEERGPDVLVEADAPVIAPDTSVLDAASPSDASRPDVELDIGAPHDAADGSPDDTAILEDTEDGLASDSADAVTGAPAFEHCMNGEDDDGDMLIDCVDPDCVGNTWCENDDVWIYANVRGRSKPLVAIRTFDPNVSYSVSSPDAPDLPLWAIGISPRGDFLVVDAQYGRSLAPYILDLRTGSLRGLPGAELIELSLAGVMGTHCVVGWLNNHEFVGVFRTTDAEERIVSALGIFDIREDGGSRMVGILPEAARPGTLSLDYDEYIFPHFVVDGGGPFGGGDGSRSEERLMAMDLRTGDVRTIDYAGAEAPWTITAIPLLNGYQWSEYLFYTADFEPGSTVQVGGEPSAPIDGQRVAVPGQTIDIRTWRGNTIGRHVIFDDAGEPIGREGVSQLYASPIIPSALEPFFVATPGE